MKNIIKCWFSVALSMGVAPCSALSTSSPWTKFEETESVHLQLTEEELSHFTAEELLALDSYLSFDESESVHLAGNVTGAMIVCGVLAAVTSVVSTACEDYREKEEKKLDRELDRELDERRMQMDYNIERSKMTPEELKRLQTIEENMRKYDEYNRKRK